MIEKISKESATKEKERGEADSEKEAVADRALDGFGDFIPVANSIGFGNHRQQQDANGVGDGTGKKNQRQCHAGQNSVNTQCLTGRAAIF